MPIIKAIVLSLVRLYYYLVRILICVPLSWPKYKDGTRIVTANMITVARVVFLIPPAIYASILGYYKTTITLLGMSYIGDTADGEYARTKGEITVFGALLDRAMDKVGNLAIIASILGFSTAAVVINSQFLTLSMQYLALIESIALLFSLVLEFTHIKAYGLTNVGAKGIGKFKMALQSIGLLLIYVTEDGINISPIVLSLMISGSATLAAYSFVGHILSYSDESAK